MASRRGNNGSQQLPPRREASTQGSVVRNKRAWKIQAQKDAFNKRTSFGSGGHGRGFKACKVEEKRLFDGSDCEFSEKAKHPVN